MYALKNHLAPLVAQWLKSLPAMQETRVRFLGREDPLEKGMATHSSILTWATPWTEDPGRLQSLGVARVRHDRVTKHPQSTIWVWSSLQNQLSVCRGTEERRHQTGPWACTWQRQLGDASNSQVLLINTCKEIQRMDEEPKIKTDLRDWSTFQMGQNILSRDAHSGNKTIKKKKDIGNDSLKVRKVVTVGAVSGLGCVHGVSRPGSRVLFLFWVVFALW